MSFEVSAQVTSLLESFAATAALERFRHCVGSHVILQIPGNNTGVRALVALVRLFPCVLPHNVNS